MSKNANQIVASLLEYGGTWGGDADERPGSPGDAWRKGGFQKFDASKMDVSGRRPGEPVEAPEEAPAEEDLPDAALAKAKAALMAELRARNDKRQQHTSNRFKWKPPTT